MDEARANNLKLAVCSAATKESVIFTLRNLLGGERFDSLDCFLAGDDVKEKKPSPTIYLQAAGAHVPTLIDIHCTFSQETTR
jgi:beta-phosphoglucomutase-like phosphatase (HAD superfamily)